MLKGRYSRCRSGAVHGAEKGATQRFDARFPRYGTELSAVLSGAVRRAGGTLPPATRLRPRSSETRNGSGPE